MDAIEIESKKLKDAIQNTKKAEEAALAANLLLTRWHKEEGMEDSLKGIVTKADGELKEATWLLGWVFYSLIKNDMITLSMKGESKQ